MLTLLTTRLDRETKLIELCKIQGRINYFDLSKDEIDWCVQIEGRKSLFTLIYLTRGNIDNLIARDITLYMYRMRFEPYT